jgi:hypothetical protein
LILDREREGVLGPVPACHLVDALARYGSHAGLGFNCAADRRNFRQWFEIGVAQFVAGRQAVLLGFLPSVFAQESLGDLIHVVAPKREQAHMTPASYIRSDGLTGLVDPHRQAAPDELRGSREANGAAADNGDGKVFDALAHAVSFVLRFEAAALPVAGAHTAGAPAQQFSVRKPSSAFICSYCAA